jgi:hypothetical protein
MSSVELSRSSDSNLSSSLFTCRIFKSRSSRKFTTRFFLERHGQGARDALTCASYSINLRRAARSRWAVGGQFSGFLKIIQRFYQIHKFWACESSRCTSGCSGPSHGKNDPGGGVESERLTFGQRGPVLVPSFRSLRQSGSREYVVHRRGAGCHFTAVRSVGFSRASFGRRPCRLSSPEKPIREPSFAGQES